MLVSETFTGPLILDTREMLGDFSLTVQLIQLATYGSGQMHDRWRAYRQSAWPARQIRLSFGIINTVSMVLFYTAPYFLSFGTSTISCYPF